MHRIVPTLLAIIAAAASSTGCRDLSQFATGPDENYCGQIVPGDFVRQGFAPTVHMRVDFNPDRIQRTPGSISTDDGMFVDAPLRSIPQLVHDSLSMLRFGEGTMRNLLYGVKPSRGATAFAFLSLLESQNIEVRIVRGAPPTNQEPPTSEDDDSDLFGVFPLTKQKGTCEF